MKGLAGAPTIEARAVARRAAQLTQRGPDGAWNICGLLMGGPAAALLRRAPLNRGIYYVGSHERVEENFDPFCQCFTLDLENLNGAKLCENFVSTRDYLRVPTIIADALDAAQQYASPALSDFITGLLSTNFPVHLSSTYGMREHPSEVRGRRTAQQNW